jgi:hypothetical protein
MQFAALIPEVDLHYGARTMSEWGRDPVLLRQPCIFKAARRRCPRCDRGSYPDEFSGTARYAIGEMSETVMGRQPAALTWLGKFGHGDKWIGQADRVSQTSAGIRD